MTEAERHNHDSMMKFLESPEGKTHKIFVVISSDENGRVKVFQSSLITPKQVSEHLFRIANQIVGALKNIPKPN